MNNTTSKPYHLIYGYPEKDVGQTIKVRYHSDNNCKYCSPEHPRKTYVDQPYDCDHRYHSLTQGEGCVKNKDGCPYCLLLACSYDKDKRIGDGCPYCLRGVSFWGFSLSKIFRS